MKDPASELRVEAMPELRQPVLIASFRGWNDGGHGASMAGAFLAQGVAPLDAASVGVLAHGLAGDAAARRWGRLGLIASDLTAALGEVWTAWGR